MQVTVQQIGSVMVIAMDGRLIGPFARVFLGMARRQLATASRPFVAIDLGQVPEVDSSGFGALVSLLTDVERRRGRLCLVRLRPEVRILLEIMQLHVLFEVRSDVEEACDALELTDRSAALVPTSSPPELLRADAAFEGNAAS